jgi:hypothetical protein
MAVARIVRNERVMGYGMLYLRNYVLDEIFYESSTVIRSTRKNLILLHISLKICYHYVIFFIKLWRVCQLVLHEKKRELFSDVDMFSIFFL